MTSRGYSAILVKDKVAERVRASAKAEGKTLTGFVEAVCDIYDTKGAVCDLSDTSMMKLEGDLEILIRGILEEMRR